MNNTEALELVQKCLDDWPYAATRVVDIMTRLEKVKGLLKEQESKTPIHIHEEYPEHDWETDEDGKIDEWAMSYEFHNGPVCKRCYHSFCIHCEPNGFNDGPCVIDEYKCPKCGCIFQKGTKFCSECGQAVKWDD